MYLPIMALDLKRELDVIDWKLLSALQRDSRMSFSELGRRVALSAPAVVERVRRMEEVGIIAGYRVALTPAKIGLPITAFLRLTTPGHMTHARFAAIVADLPEVMECHRVTGPECYMMKVLVTSIEHLERLIETLRPHGQTTSSHRALDRSRPPSD